MIIVKNIEAQYQQNIIEEFANWLVEQGKAELTVKTYIAVIEKFQSWLSLADKGLSEIYNSDVQTYMDYLEEQQKNPGTIEKYLAAISVFARFTGHTEIVLDIHKKEKDKDHDTPESLTDIELEKVLSEVKADGNHRNIAIVYTLLHTGLRISELCTLDRSDLDLTGDKGKLFVRNNDGEVERVVPLSSEVRMHLTSYIESNRINEGALFISNANNRMTPRAIQYMLEKYNVSPHKLRHTFCQQLINKGIDIHTVAKLAGHKDVNVTKKYVKELNISLEDAIDQAF